LNRRLPGDAPQIRAAIRAAEEPLLAAAGLHAHDISVAGQRVHLVERGAGRPVVMLHSTGSCGLLLGPMLGQMGEMRVMAPDRPGHGLSEPVDLPRNRFREAAVDWTGRLLDSLELDSTVLCGHSGGALWALWYALAHPARVDRLVLIAPIQIRGTRVPAPFRVLATPGLGSLVRKMMRPSEKSLLQLMGFFGDRDSMANHPGLIDLLVANANDSVTARTEREEVRALGSPFALLTPSGFRRELRVDEEELAGLAVPTLVVWGERDPQGFVDVAAAAANAIPDGRLEVVPGAHFPWLTDPQRSAQVVGDFAISGG